MGLFRPYEQTKRTDQEKRSSLSSLTPSKKDLQPERPAETPTAEPTQRKVVRRQHQAKEGPTPTRAEAQAARMERLHPNLSKKEMRKRDREERFRARNAAWERMEAAPERRLLRDYVDTRWTILEFMLPLMLIVMAMSMVSLTNVTLYFATMIAMWVLMLASIVNFVILWRGYRKLLAERYPTVDVRGKGLRMYMFNRALFIRRWRRPAPEINRGDPVR